MEGADVVTPGPTRPPGILHIRKNTQKSKFLLSQAFNWKKIMFFVIPEMPSKTGWMAVAGKQKEGVGINMKSAALQNLFKGH